MKKLYERVEKKVTNLIGFEGSNHGSKEAALDKLLAGSMFGAQALNDFLSYRYFDSESGNFLLSQGSAGFMLQISPLVGISDKVVKSLNLFLAKELPKDGILQFFLMASSDIDDFLGAWKDGRKTDHPILNRITEERIKYLKTRH